MFNNSSRVSSVRCISWKCANDSQKTAAGNTQTLTYGYDSYGNVTSSTLTASGTAEQVKSTATYTGYGNYLSTVTDSMGNANQLQLSGRPA